MNAMNEERCLLRSYPFMLFAFGQKRRNYSIQFYCRRRSITGSTHTQKETPRGETDLDLTRQPYPLPSLPPQPQNMSCSTTTALDYELDRIKHESTRHVRDILLQQHHHQEQALLTLQAHLERALRTKQEALQLAANSDALRLQSEARCHDLETVVSREEMHSQQLREELEATRQELHGTCQALRRQEELVEELSAQLRQLVQENDRQRQSMMEEVRSRQALLNEIQLGRAAQPPQPQRPSSNERLLASQQGNSTAAAAASSSASGNIHRPAATSNDGAMVADGEGPPRQQLQDDPRYPTTASTNASLRSADVHRQETVTPTVDRRRIVGSSGHGGGGVSSSGSGGARWVDPAFLSRLPQARATLDSTPSSMQQQQKSHVPSSFPDAEKQRRDGSSTMSLLHPQDEGQQRGNYRSTAASFSSSSLLLLRSPVVPSDLRHPPPR